jgi:phytoene dehydrogenase-like protein
MAEKKYDVIVVGAGHNGLILGNYLAKAGLKVLVIERRLEVGGGLSTEEITIPAFLHNLHSYFHDTINIMPPYDDLKMEAFNARYYRPPVQAGMILPDGRSLCFYDDLDKTCERVLKKRRRKVAGNCGQLRSVCFHHHSARLLQPPGLTF